MGKGGGSAPAIEPVKPAAEVMKEAASSTARAQQLRRGLASTFSREGFGSGPRAATAGMASKLGG